MLNYQRVLFCFDGFIENGGFSKKISEKLVFHAQHKKPIGWVMQRSWVWSYKCDLVGGLEHVLFFHI